MSATFIPLESAERLDSLFRDSFTRAVTIFKHSNSCGISAHIMEQISTVDSEINVVVVQTHRDISNEIEERTGIRHQTPQLFVLADGNVIHNASHYSIAPERLREALR